MKYKISYLYGSLGSLYVNTHVVETTLPRDDFEQQVIGQGLRFRSMTITPAAILSIEVVTESWISKLFK